LKVVWFAAGQGYAPGVYFAESKDKGQSFTPRQLLSQESVRGTPALTATQNNAIALWQSSDTAETKMRVLGNAGSARSVAAGAELPAAVFSNDKLLVAYIATEKDKRSIWLIRAE
jgi:hypothetical protein